MAADSPFDPANRLRRDIGRHLRGAFLLVAIGVSLGVALIPRGDELLLIHVRNNDIDQARRVLANREANGVSTVSSVVAHGELFLLEGHVDEALVDLEGFVASHADDAAAWKRLARLYQYAQRLEDQVRALAQVYRLEPTPDLARELAMFYRWTGDEGSEAARLRELVTTGHADVGEMRRSARLEAAFGRHDAAVAVLEKLAREAPAAFEYADLDLYASLLVDAGRSATLGEHVQRLVLIRRDPAALPQLATSMRRRGWAMEAVQLFAAPPGRQVAPALLAGRARAAQGTAAAPEVLRGLIETDAVHRLADEPLDAAVKLALSLHDASATDRLFARHADTLAPVLVGLAVGQAISAGDRTRAQDLVKRFGDEGLADSPLLALELAAERGDFERAYSWIERMDAEGVDDPEEVAAVAKIEVTLELDGQAFDRLMRLAGSGHAPDWAYGDLTALAERLARVDEALQVLAPQPAATIAHDRRRAWARLAASAGRGDLLDAWLAAGTIGPADAETLRDVYFLASDQGEVARAAAFAERLFSVRGTAEDASVLRQALARDLNEGEDPVGEVQAAALKALRDARRQNASLDERRPLVDALWGAGERASIADEVLGLAARDLDGWLSAVIETAGATGRRAEAVSLIASADGGLGALDGRRRMDRVRALVELDAPDDVLLPELRRLAYTVGESWVFLYDEHLGRGHRASEQVELWTTVGRAAATSAADRRAAAARLVDLQAPADAAGVLEVLAANAGPNDPDVQQLLSLRGTTPGDHAGWLLSRLATAPAVDRMGWQRLVIDAHRAAGDRAALGHALFQVISSPDADTDALRHAGRTALAESLTDLAATAFRGVAARESGDRESARWVGTLAFYDRRGAEARQSLDAYERLGGNEPEPIFQLGELAREDGRHADAHAYYERVLDGLADGRGAVVASALLANVLVRLEERERAGDVFEALLREAPANDHVRADFGSALLQWGDYDRAWRVLDAQPRVARAVGADESGARRLDLLRLQWLNFEGRYPDAQRVIESLEARFPADVDVRLARASFDQARGHAVQADAQYAAIRRDAPERQDVATLVQTLERQRAPHASFQFESRSVTHAWEAASTRVDIAGRVASHVPVTVTAERFEFTAPQSMTPDGHVAPLARTLTRVEAGATLPLAPGASLSGALFATSGGVGGGATVERHDLRGAWKATLERGRPFWEFVESVAGDGRKDRVGIQRDWRFSADTAGWVLLDANRYRLSSGASASTTALTLGVIRTVRHGAPTLTLQYGVDKEHVRGRSLTTAFDGRLFAPIPITSREVHLLGGVTRFSIRPLWDVEASAGYTFDRLGGRGSFLTARATPVAGSRIGLELWGDRRLYLLATTQQALRGGVRLAVRF